jgi:hypothetical protein
MSVVPDIHDVLHWSNRTLVAEEITRRGFRVSKETLNRWVRQRKEVPAVVRDIVFDIFGIGQQETPPPWAEAMQERIVGELAVNRELIGALANPELLETAQRVIARLEAQSAQPDVDPGGRSEAAGRAAAAPPGRGRA